MHKAYRLVAGGESAICASGLDKRQFVYCTLEMDCKFVWLTNLGESYGHAQSPLQEASQVHATHRLGARTRGMTQLHIQLSNVCCSLRTCWPKWSQRNLKIPLETSELLKKRFPRSGVYF